MDLNVILYCLAGATGISLIAAALLRNYWTTLIAAVIAASYAGWIAYFMYGLTEHLNQDFGFISQALQFLFRNMGAPS